MKGPCTLMKRALITGVTGQDGSCLAELLLSKGYEVHGINMTDSHSVLSLVQKTLPDETYNLAAQSHVGVSFEQPECNADALGALRVLEVRSYQASSSETCA